MKRIGFATHEGIPELTEDDLLAARELKLLGIDVVPIVWDRPSLAEDLRAVVVRSCWNYHLHLDAFIDWLEFLAERGTMLLNSPRIIRWNVRKDYLKDLAAQGAVIPKTIWIKRGARATLRELLRENGITEAVVKPVVSLSAFETWRTVVPGDHQRRFETLVAERDVMVQEYVREISTEGELSFVFLGGEYSHSVLKRPVAGDFRVQEDFGGSREAIVPSNDLVEQATAVVELIEEPLLYARVDGVNVGGQLVLMELELIDPVLFLAYDQRAPARFAEVIVRAFGR